MKIAPLYIKLMKDKSLTTLEGLIEHLPQAVLEFANAANLSVTTKVCVCVCSVCACVCVCVWVRACVCV